MTKTEDARQEMADEVKQIQLWTKQESRQIRHRVKFLLNLLSRLIKIAIIGGSPPQKKT